MTVAQIALIKKTWRNFRSIDPELIGEVFYSRLFSKYPRLQTMFVSPMNEQSAKLINMLTMMVTRLERFDEITDDIKQLAIRHAGYGVKPAHYKAVGEALLWTLEKGLGNDWNDEVKEAWAACYSSIAATMMAAT